MAIDRNKNRRKTYKPVNFASVRRFDEAGATGAKKLEKAEQRATESVTSTPLITLLKSGAGAKPLK
ncbi:MAG: hypothetical protein J0H42_25095 [Rhizobiales bacterium]|nr:hypothetical protein [Hyphomicrobiales bacterium]